MQARAKANDYIQLPLRPRVKPVRTPLPLIVKVIWFWYWLFAASVAGVVVWLIV